MLNVKHGKSDGEGYRRFLLSGSCGHEDRPRVNLLTFSTCQQRLTTHTSLSSFHGAVNRHEDREVEVVRVDMVAVAPEFPHETPM